MYLLKLLTEKPTKITWRIFESNEKKNWKEIQTYTANKFEKILKFEVVSLSKHINKMYDNLFYITKNICVFVYVGLKEREKKSGPETLYVVDKSYVDAM